MTTRSIIHPARTLRASQLAPHRPPAMTRPLILALAALIAPIAFAGTAQGKEWPAPIKALEVQHDVEIVGSFAAPGGVTGYAARAQGQALSLYLTADGKHVIVGPMFDERGVNLSEAPLERLLNKPLDESVWQQLGTSRWIADGEESATRVVYVFTDPNCPYCHKFWSDARPWVSSGKVQLRHVLVGVLGPTSPAKAAALLMAKDPSAALRAYEQQPGSAAKPVGDIPAAVKSQLDANLRLMRQFGPPATPTIVYRDAQGKLQKMQGAPAPDKLAQVLGPL